MCIVYTYILLEISVVIQCLYRGQEHKSIQHSLVPRGPACTHNTNGVPPPQPTG